MVIILGFDGSEQGLSVAEQVAQLAVGRSTGAWMPETLDGRLSERVPDSCLWCSGSDEIGTVGRYRNYLIQRELELQTRESAIRSWPART
jgi:hypothetical protein